MKSTNGLPAQLVLVACALCFGWLLVTNLKALLDGAINSLQP